MKSVFWIYGQEVLLRMPAVWDRKDLCPPGKEEFRSKVSSCKAPPWGPVPFYIFLLREKVPLPYPVPSINKWYPFQIPSLKLCITFSCKCTVVKLWINQKTSKLSRLFHSHKILLLALLGLFTDQNDTDFPTLSYISTTPEVWKRYPFRNSGGVTPYGSL